MVLAIRSEFRKFFTTRMWWGMGLAVIVASLAFPALYAFIFTSDGMAEIGASAIPDSELAKTVYTGGIQLAYLLTLAIGVLTIGAEYRHKTITGTFLATPKRAKVMLAKVVSLLGIGGLYGIVSVVAAFSIGAIILNAKGHAIWPDSSVGRTLALYLLVLGLWALIGLGIGILIPNQIAALFIAIGVAWIVEPLLSVLLATQEWGKGIVRFFPSSATNAVLGSAAQSGGGEAIPAFPWWGAALVLVAYAAIMAAVGHSSRCGATSPERCRTPSGMPARPRSTASARGRPGAYRMARRVGAPKRPKVAWTPAGPGVGPPGLTPPAQPSPTSTSTHRKRRGTRARPGEERQPHGRIRAQRVARRRALRPVAQ
jgi:ABC-2 type transport system permease protein